MRIHLLMKTLMSCLMIFSTLFFIFSFSASSSSATFDTASTRTRDPNTCNKEIKGFISGTWKYAQTLFNMKVCACAHARALMGTGKVIFLQYGTIPIN